MKNRFIITCFIISCLFTFSSPAQTPGLLYGMMPTEPFTSGNGLVFNYDPLSRSINIPLTFNLTNGGFPYGNLIQAYNATLYGMTSIGGGNGVGVIFSLNPISGKDSTIYSLDTIQGFAPYGSLMQASDSMLYGMTSKGGTNGYGVIFSFNPVTATYLVLHNFDSADGATPLGSLMQASNGLLYGMTNKGGGSGGGVLFSYDINLHKYAVLLNFSYPNATNPYGSLIQASNGLLYGLAYLGGTDDDGAIFSFNTLTDTDSVVYNFDITHGANPYGSLMQATDGYLYGMTEYSEGTNGRGEVFRFNTVTNTIAVPVILEDTLPQYGFFPQGSLIQTANGSLYGMTKLGGISNFGVLFRYDTGKTEDTVLVNLTNVNGISPEGDLLEVMTATITTGDNLCYGDSAGWAAIHVRGGHYPLTYTWSNGNSTDSITGLKAGAYTATVRDAKGIYYSFNFNITQPSKIIDSTPLVANVKCNGGNDGKIVLAIKGGVKPYQYLWSLGGTSDSITNLKPGSYSCTITDSNHCISSFSFNITQPAKLIDSTVSSTNVTCYGNNSGSANVGATGGTIPYTYMWSGTGGTNALAANLVAGNYTCTVKDSNGCVTFDTVTITSPKQIKPIISYTTTPCSKSNGAVSIVSVSGGVGPYSYLWMPDSVKNANDTALSAGSYTCIVTDSLSCKVMATVYVPNTGGPHDSITSLKNITCYGDSNGSASGLAAKGKPPYTYSWFPSGGTATTAAGLKAGTYTFTTTDSIGCVGTATVAISQPLKLVDSIVKFTNVPCFGDSSGSAIVGVSGGTAPYTYFWSGIAKTSSSVTSLIAGVYTVVVIDSNHCNDSTTVTITSPSPISLTGSKVANNCGFNNGSATVVANGGTAPYSYAWAPGGKTSSSISNVFGGTYTCIVTDTFKCRDTLAIVVPNKGGPRDTITSSANVGPCNGDKNGSIIAKEISAQGAYTFSWSPSGGTNSFAFNLGAGTYTCTITDSTGCTGQDTVTITQPTKIIPVIKTVGVCYGQTIGGSAVINVSGGYPPYTYSWSNSATTTSISNLSIGSYFCTVTDSDTCSVIEACNVLAGIPLKIDSIVSHPTSCGGCTDGWIKVIVSGGVPPGDSLDYIYFWGTTTSPTTDTITYDSNLAIGTYTVDISTPCGTDSSVIANVIAGLQNVSNADNDIEMYPVPSKGIVYIVLPQLHAVDLSITNEIGSVVYSSNISAESLNSTNTISLEGLPDGVYIARFVTEKGVITKKIVLQK